MWYGPGLLLRVEGLVAAIVAVACYARSGGSWLLFVLLILAPDLSILGYLGGSRVGAAAYNIVHTYVLPLALAAYGYASGSALALNVAVIWLAHISIDRALGFGLKYPTAFQDTHFNRV